MQRIVISSLLDHTNDLFGHLGINLSFIKHPQFLFYLFVYLLAIKASNYVTW